MSKHTILLVDDESNTRMTAGLCLEEAGYIVRQACSGSEALEQIALDPPDVMLLDLAMPVLDGMSVLAELRTQWHRYPTRVIVVTAHGSIKTAIEALRLGASDFIEKPLSPSELRQGVASVLGLDRRPVGPTTADGEGYVAILERVRKALCAREFSVAERELARAEKLGGKGDVAYLNLAGVVQEAHGRVESAVTFYSRAFEHDCAYRAAFENLARLNELKEVGRTSRCVALGGDKADDRPQEFLNTMKGACS